MAEPLLSSFEGGGFFAGRGLFALGGLEYGNSSISKERAKKEFFCFRILISEKIKLYSFFLKIKLQIK